MASTAGAIYLAREQQSLEPCEPQFLGLPAPGSTAPLFECAAVHDGQPPTDWLRMFRSLWSGAATSTAHPEAQ